MILNKITRLSHPRIYEHGYEANFGSKATTALEAAKISDLKVNPDPQKITSEFK